eukprot:TRINITY_DN9636_c0_g1_i2.p1 TRINITY_DN9636_c0_g1~~TRINITY_DN9636_c0_g1_i2.p1  ORF type:complete len:361 (+),score=61.03 TRINITY_DN9636_c0_g1_i2:345-1427(+)
MGNTQAFHFDGKCRQLPERIDPGRAEFSLKHQGRRRGGVVHFPASFKTDFDRKRPVLVLFHPTGGSGAEFADLTRIAELADLEDFIAVFPNGTGRCGCWLDWAAAGVHPQKRQAKRGIDDVDFFLTLMDKLELHLPIDATRVYAAGFSSGGAMCHRLAADPRASQRLAGIASVMGTVDMDAFKPAHPMPVLHIHSVDDPIALFDGGSTENRCIKRLLGSQTHPPVQAVLDRWIRHNNGLSNQQELGPAVAQSTRREAVIAKIKHSAEHMAWSAPATAPVELIKLTGAGHQWPSAAGSRHPCCVEEYMGPATTIIDANMAIWQFFERIQTRHRASGPEADKALFANSAPVNTAPPAYDAVH